MTRQWRDRAACRDVDPETFFPVAEAGPALAAQVARAKAVCARCPVLADCLTDALTRIPDGIAGGLTADERRRLRLAQRRPSSTAGRPTTAATARATAGRALLAAGCSVADTAHRAGVSHRTAQRWAALERASCTPSTPTTSTGGTP